MAKSHIHRIKLERAKGIEPSYSAWKAAALPLCYAREKLRSTQPLYSLITL